MQVQAVIALVIGVAIVLFVPGLVWAGVTAGMGEVPRWCADLFRAMVGLTIMLCPGVIFWLVVIGIIAIIQRLSRTDLCQIVRDTVRESLKAVAQKAARAVGKVS
jgi:hypothetical protein